MQSGCSKCGNPAVYLRRYTAERLCQSCLAQTTTDRVRRTINRQKMLLEDDRIAVAISGGKDSAVLLHILHNIESNFPKSKLIPVIIDEGITGYRDKALEAAKQLTKSLSLPLEIISFKSLFGYSLDELVKMRTDTSLGACSYCGVLRRRAMNDAAERLKADVIATGHNLDDEAQTVLMNVMRGDSRRIARTNVPRSRSIEGLVPRIKPLTEISERDIVAYSHHMNLVYHDVPCPYAGEAYRNDLRVFLNDMEHKRPGTLLAILRSAEDMTEAFLNSPSEWTLQRCEKCNTPSSSSICKACKMLDEIKR
ncbi:MAG: TIGR00269 family protein [Candidatus Thorarchaeota archaeon]